MTLALFGEVTPAAPLAPPEVRLWLDCIPPTANHQRKKIVRFKVAGKQITKLGDRDELVEAKSTLEALLLPHQIPTPVPGPIALELSFTWPWLSTHRKKTRVLGRIPHTSRPDADNAAKTIADRLSKLRFIEYDARVAELHVSKWWGDRPGIAVVIRTIR